MEYFPVHLTQRNYTKNWREVANQFQRKANFPMCPVAIDGEHIRIENFPHAGSINLN